MAIKNVSATGVNGAGLSKPQESKANKQAENAASIATIAAQTPSMLSTSNQNKDFGINISDRAKARSAEQKKAFDIAKKTPDIREDKVAEMKAKLASGTYEVDSGKIADGMLREAFREHLASSRDE